jgi:hypothetical protein
MRSEEERHFALKEKCPIQLRKQMPFLLEDADQDITPRMRKLLDHLWQEWKQLNFDVDSIASNAVRFFSLGA